MIGIFDSGVGGLTLLRALIATHPHASFLYLADNANLPYGSKSPEWIAARSLALAQFLIAQGATTLIIACHTASVICGEHLRATLPVPVVDMVSPSLEHLPERGTIAVLATHRTTQSGKYPQLIAALRPHLEVLSLACPEFVPLVESGIFDGAQAEDVVRRSLAPLGQKHVDLVLLACTHYPLLQKPLERILGGAVAILNPAENIPRKIRARKESRASQFMVTGDIEEFQRTASIICAQPVENVNQVTVTS